MTWRAYGSCCKTIDVGEMPSSPRWLTPKKQTIVLIHLRPRKGAIRYHGLRALGPVVATPAGLGLRLNSHQNPTQANYEPAKAWRWWYQNKAIDGLAASG